MSSYILGFQEIDKTKLVMVGGKGANLGELSGIEGIQVPEGFCVTTEAYKEIIGKSEEFNLLLDQLVILKADNRKGISEISAKIRKVIEETAIPKALKSCKPRSFQYLAGISSPKVSQTLKLSTDVGNPSAQRTITIHISDITIRSAFKFTLDSNNTAVNTKIYNPIFLLFCVTSYC